MIVFMKISLVSVTIVFLVMLLFSGLFKRYSQIVQRYFIQYLSGFDVALLKTIIQVGMVDNRMSIE